MEEKECKLCDRIWGVFGLILAVGFLYISIDVLTGGFITTAIAGKGKTDDE